MSSQNNDREQREKKTLTLGYSPGDDLWPFTLLAGARSFLKIADAAVTQLGALSDGDDLTILFLLAQSIELSLKTVLRFHCVSEERLIELGHRLAATLDAAHKEGLPKRPATDRKLLQLLDLSYDTGLLRYRRASEMAMPIMRAVRDLAGELLTIAAGGTVERPLTPKDYEGPPLAEMRKGAEGTDLRQLAMRWLAEQQASRKKASELDSSAAAPPATLATQPGLRDE